MRPRFRKYYRRRYYSRNNGAPESMENHIATVNSPSVIHNAEHNNYDDVTGNEIFENTQQQPPFPNTLLMDPNDISTTSNAIINATSAEQYLSLPEQLSNIPTTTTTITPRNTMNCSVNVVSSEQPCMHDEQLNRFVTPIALCTITIPGSLWPNVLIGDASSNEQRRQIVSVYEPQFEDLNSDLLEAQFVRDWYNRLFDLSLCKNRNQQLQQKQQQRQQYYSNKRPSYNNKFANNQTQTVGQSVANILQNYIQTIVDCCTIDTNDNSNDDDNTPNDAQLIGQSYYRITDTHNHVTTRHMTSYPLLHTNSNNALSRCTTVTLEHFVELLTNTYLPVILSLGSTRITIPQLLSEHCKTFGDNVEALQVIILDIKQCEHLLRKTIRQYYQTAKNNKTISSAGTIINGTATSTTNNYYLLDNRNIVSTIGQSTANDRIVYGSGAMIPSSTASTSSTATSVLLEFNRDQTLNDLRQATDITDIFREYTAFLSALQTRKWRMIGRINRLQRRLKVYERTQQKLSTSNAIASDIYNSIVEQIKVGQENIIHVSQQLDTMRQLMDTARQTLVQTYTNLYNHWSENNEQTRKMCETLRAYRVRQPRKTYSTLNRDLVVLDFFRCMEILRSTNVLTMKLTEDEYSSTFERTLQNVARLLDYQQQQEQQQQQQRQHHQTTTLLCHSMNTNRHPQQRQQQQSPTASMIIDIPPSCNDGDEGVTTSTSILVNETLLANAHNSTNRSNANNVLATLLTNVRSNYTYNTNNSNNTDTGTSGTFNPPENYLTTADHATTDLNETLIGEPLLRQPPLPPPPLRPPPSQGSSNVSQSGNKDDDIFAGGTTDITATAATTTTTTTSRIPSTTVATITATPAIETTANATTIPTTSVTAIGNNFTAVSANSTTTTAPNEPGNSTEQQYQQQQQQQKRTQPHFDARIQRDEVEDRVRRIHNGNNNVNARSNTGNNSGGDQGNFQRSISTALRLLLDAICATRKHYRAGNWEYGPSDIRHMALAFHRFISIRLEALRMERELNSTHHLLTTVSSPNIDSLVKSPILCRLANILTNSSTNINTAQTNLPTTAGQSRTNYNNDIVVSSSPLSTIQQHSNQQSNRNTVGHINTNNTYPVEQQPSNITASNGNTTIRQTGQQHLSGDTLVPNQRGGLVVDFNRITINDLVGSVLNEEEEESTFVYMEQINAELQIYVTSEEDQCQIRRPLVCRPIGDTIILLRELQDSYDLSSLQNMLNDQFDRFLQIRYKTTTESTNRDDERDKWDERQMLRELEKMTQATFRENLGTWDRLIERTKMYERDAVEDDSKDLPTNINFSYLQPQNDKRTKLSITERLSNWCYRPLDTFNLTLLHARFTQVDDEAELRRTQKTIAHYAYLLSWLLQMRTFTTKEQLEYHKSFTHGQLTDPRNICSFLTTTPKEDSRDRLPPHTYNDENDDDDNEEVLDDEEASEDDNNDITTEDDDDEMDIDEEFNEISDSDEEMPLRPSTSTATADNNTNTKKHRRKRPLPPSSSSTVVEDDNDENPVTKRRRIERDHHRDDNRLQLAQTIQDVQYTAESSSRQQSDNYYYQQDYRDQRNRNKRLKRLLRQHRKKKNSSRNGGAANTGFPSTSTANTKTNRRRQHTTTNAGNTATTTTTSIASQYLRRLERLAETSPSSISVRLLNDTYRDEMNRKRILRQNIRTILANIRSLTNQKQRI